ncbi:SGNH/GDSL hydrolase family protein [Nocardioides sp.]|uniref:SGNH/GDSL hydrolase family protein n=1 Tax=Nocardioides sp. TaxID=35761 RepID=UPI0035689D9F
MTFRRRHTIAGGVLGLLLTGLLAGGQPGPAGGAVVTGCERHAAASLARDVVVGEGRRVVVIGDSWAVGAGLREPTHSWPSRLPGAVRVAGFSGSGFSRTASRCAGASYADRSAAALARGADLVVVQGGLNDVDQSTAAIEAGFRDLVRELRGYRVVVVGPAIAPARAAAVPRVNAVLGRLADEHGIAYVDATGRADDYLPDGLHLTRDGHRAFGAAIAAALSELPGLR